MTGTKISLSRRTRLRLKTLWACIQAVYTPSRVPDPYNKRFPEESDIEKSWKAVGEYLYIAMESNEEKTKG